MDFSEDKIIQDIVEDKAFLKNILTMDMKEAQNAFAERGVELSENDMFTIEKLVGLQINNLNSVSGEVLKNVSGGGGITNKIKNISMAIASVIVAGASVYMVSKLDTAVNKVGVVADNMSSVSSKANKTLEQIGAAADNISGTASKANKTLGQLGAAADTADQILKTVNDPNNGTWLKKLFGFGLKK